LYITNVPKKEAFKNISESCIKKDSIHGYTGVLTQPAMHDLFMPIIVNPITSIILTMTASPKELEQTGCCMFSDSAQVRLHKMFSHNPLFHGAPIAFLYFVHCFWGLYAIALILAASKFIIGVTDFTVLFNSVSRSLQQFCNQVLCSFFVPAYVHLFTHTVHKAGEGFLCL
jgi:hypothetical protein